MKPDFNLAGQRALVIGGGTGIGRAIALGLAGAGADVSVAGRRQAVLDDVCAAIRALGRHSDAHVLDATDQSQLVDLVARLNAADGTPDILVNAQGVMTLKPSIDVDASDYSHQMDTNTKSVWFACTGFGRLMLTRGSGVILNVASMTSFRGFPRNAIYAISKHGVRSITESLAAEWANSGVRVNGIAPGFFITDLNRGALTDERRERALARIPMGRFGVLDELAGAAVYLASPAASYVTGVTLPVDGGFLAVGL